MEKWMQEYGLGRAKQEKGLFASLFILQNRLQTAFDKEQGELTLKQFMLLVMARQAQMHGESPTFMELGRMLGCSRQNIKKLAALLQKNGFVELRANAADPRACAIVPTPKTEQFLADYAHVHEEKLHLLFADYSDEQLSLFYECMMKLYEGTGRIEAGGKEMQQ